MKHLFFTACVIFLAGITQAQTQTGKASFYADKFEGRMTASGEKYKHNKLTAAHKTLPFGTKVRVTNISNGNVVDVTVNDRGPYAEGRIIDLSKSAAEKLGFVALGLAEVRVDVIDAGDGKSGMEVKTIDRVVVDEKEFYDFEIDRLQPKGFGVQIGTYQELVNLMRLAENLKGSYKKKVVVQVKILNGVKYYSLILGQFPSRDKADKFRASVKNKYPDAFIAEFDKMK
ncbi:MAG TPA: septal ring lytic transglycosylase RlpA family protein [Cyclobacteriaceae bacterium]|nr:septal ring lytic transglycosylase RlpA family protein [Cyclobacteriaceae bacterium]